MWTFIGLASFVTWVVFLVLIIVSKVKKKERNFKKDFLIAGVAFVVFIVAVAATPNKKETKQAAGGGSVAAATSTPTSKPTPDPKEEEAKKKAADEAKAKAEAEAKAKTEADAKVKAEAEAKAADPAEIAKKSASKHFGSAAEINYDNSNGFLLIKVLGQDNFTNNMIKDGMWIDATDTLKDLKGVQAIKDVTFNITFPMVDAYGNTSNDIIMKINLTASTRSKINYDNFSFSNLPKIADSYWQHPAFSK